MKIHWSKEVLLVQEFSSVSTKATHLTYLYRSQGIEEFIIAKRKMLLQMKSTFLLIRKIPLIEFHEKLLAVKVTI